MLESTGPITKRPSADRRRRRSNFSHPKASMQSQLNPYSLLRRGSVSDAVASQAPILGSFPIALALRGDKIALSKAVGNLNPTEFRLIWADEQGKCNVGAGADAVLLAPPDPAIGAPLPKSDFLMWLSSVEPPPSTGAIHISSPDMLLDMLVSLFPGRCGCPSVSVDR